MISGEMNGLLLVKLHAPPLLTTKARQEEAIAGKCRHCIRAAAQYSSVPMSPMMTSSPRLAHLHRQESTTWATSAECETPLPRFALVTNCFIGPSGDRQEGRKEGRPASQTRPLPPFSLSAKLRRPQCATNAICHCRRPHLFSFVRFFDAMTFYNTFFCRPRRP